MEVSVQDPRRLPGSKIIQRPFNKNTGLVEQRSSLGREELLAASVNTMKGRS